MLLSAVILTHNEGKDIGRCLDCLSFADEVIAVDDESDKNSLQYLASIKTYRRKLNGDFAAQRNFGLEKAHGEWVLFVDPDEVVDKKLAAEIQQKISSPGKVVGYYLPRRDFFWGRALGHGETGEIRLLRLAKKTAGRWERRVHEFWKIEGDTETLAHPLLHYPHPTIAAFLASINFYTDLDAPELLQEGKKFNCFRLLVNPAGKFLQNFVIRLGFLDGYPGLAVAVLMSMHSLIVRVKLYEIGSR